MRAEILSCTVTVEHRRKHLERQRRRNELRRSFQGGDDHVAKRQRGWIAVRQLLVSLYPRRLISGRVAAILPRRRRERRAAFGNLLWGQHAFDRQKHSLQPEVQA